jgi:hypothetical protein
MDNWPNHNSFQSSLRVLKVIALLMALWSLSNAGVYAADDNPAKWLAAGAATAAGLHF